jgi:hypothetical protein
MINRIPKVLKLVREIFKGPYTVYNQLLYLHLCLLSKGLFPFAYLSTQQVELLTQKQKQAISGLRYRLRLDLYKRFCTEHVPLELRREYRREYSQSFLNFYQALRELRKLMLHFYDIAALPGE